MNEKFMKNADNQNVVDSGIPRSGVNLSHRSLGTGVIGHLIPINQEIFLPQSRVQIANDVRLTFEQLATQTVEPVNVEQYNSLIRIKSLYGRSEFEQALVKQPNSLNTQNVLDKWLSWVDVLKTWFLFTGTMGQYQNEPASAHSYSTDMRVNYRIYRDHIMYLATTPGVSLPHIPATTFWRDSYTGPFFSQYLQYLDAFSPSVTDTDLYVLWYMIRPIFGEGSLLDQLGYPILTLAMVKDSHNGISLSLNPDTSNNTIVTFMTRSTMSVPFTQNLNTLALRHYYAFWFETFRDRTRMPVSNYLMDWHTDFHLNWKGASGNYTLRFGEWAYMNSSLYWQHASLLIPRLGNWASDMYNTASVDDVSRHIYTPIQNSTPVFKVGTNFIDSSPMGNQIVAETVSYIDPVTGASVSKELRLPFMGNSVEVSTTAGAGLDLRRLRHSQMFENVMKRLFYYGGDEYPEYIMGLYGSQIADYSVYRPQIISASRSSMDVSSVQAVASDTESSTAPIRQSQMQGTAAGDSGSFFVDDLSHMLSVIMVKPQVQYDPTYHGNMICHQYQLPLPQLSMDNDEISNTSEFARNIVPAPFGHHVYAHNWRQRVGEIHGRYLQDYKAMTFSRTWSANAATAPKNNAIFLLCAPSFPMFVDSIALDGQFYYMANHTCLAEVPLASPTTIL